jgi:oxygen-independent coproporphyrinogen-3 oxidase
VNTLNRYNQKKCALYIHWPFCESKCPYCDFNSHVMRTISEQEWIDAIIFEMRRTHQQMEMRELSSIFFGGGTPSLMSPDAMGAVIAEARSLWMPGVIPVSVQDGWYDLEITMEANPGSVEAARFKGYAEAGVNRLSLGIQALNDGDLEALGRKHSVRQALAALEIAQNTFDRVSLDLIYARPNQTVEAWREELAFALTLGTTHLSLYQLTIEAGTAFAPLHARGELIIPEENEAYDLYKATAEMTSAAGFRGYETSNYAKAGHECRHNLTYWNYGDYVGVGPGAHGRLHLASGKAATQQIKAPRPWVDAVVEKGTGDQSVTGLDGETQFHEQLMMGLRLTAGIAKAVLVRPLNAAEQKRLNVLETEGLAVPGDERLQLTPRGALVLNSVLGYLYQPE